MLIFTRDLRGLMGWMDGGEGDLERLRREVKEEEDKKWKRQTIAV